MPYHAKQCYSMHFKDKFLEIQYAVSESDNIFRREVYHPNAHSSSAWEAVAGLPNPEYLRFFDTTHQTWILPG